MLLTVRANVELLVCMPMPEAAHGVRARQAVAGVAFSTEVAPGAVSTEAVEGTVDRAPAASVSSTAPVDWHLQW